MGLGLGNAKAPRQERALFVAERIGELALKGDLEVERVWKQIATRLDRLCEQATVEH